MKKIQGFAAGFFIFAVSILGIISILGIWKILEGNVITKSFETLGLLALVAIIIMIAGRFITTKSEEGAVIYAPNPAWKSIRKVTLGILIVAVSVLALMGVLAIWDVISDKNVLYRSLGSVATLAFSAFVIVMTCLGMEHDPSLQQDGKPRSSGSVAGMILGGLFLFYIISMLIGFGGRW